MQNYFKIFVLLISTFKIIILKISFQNYCNFILSVFTTTIKIDNKAKLKKKQIFHVFMLNVSEPSIQLYIANQNPITLILRLKSFRKIQRATEFLHLKIEDIS